ncbi:MAG: hypothetical protein ACJASJ_001767 [Candidatus Azotimanducaceae bacterium]|jgi:hypothetical protein|tara:strand:- start:11787 stop:11918 length:132 start_codon:yes stop_codon:yes gene_type:complete
MTTAGAPLVGASPDALIMLKMALADEHYPYPPTAHPLQNERPI